MSKNYFYILHKITFFKNLHEVLRVSFFDPYFYIGKYFVSNFSTFFLTQKQYFTATYGSKCAKGFFFLYKKYGSKIGTGILFLYKCMGQKMTHEVLRVLFFSTIFYVKVDILNPYFTKKSCFCIINVPKKYTEILFIQKW